MAKRKSGRAHMAWVRSFKKNSPRRRHRRARRNPWPVAGLVANPRRRRRSRARRNPAIRRYRRNPGHAISIAGFQLPALQSVIYAGVGFAGTPIAEGFLARMLPLSLTTNVVGKYAVKIGTVLGLTYAAKMFAGREAARLVGIGGGAYVLLSAVREFAPGVIPGLSAYTPSLSAYTPIRKSLGAPNFGAQNTPGFAPGGARNVVAARFRRFQ